MAYTYSGTAEFSGDPKGDWVLSLLDSGTLTFRNLSTNVDVFLVGGGANGGANSYFDGNQWGTGNHYSGGKGGYSAKITTVENMELANGTYDVEIGASGGATNAFGKTAAGGTSSSGGKEGGAGEYEGTATAGKNGEYAFGESSFSHALGAGFRFSASGGGGAGGVPATSSYGTAAKGGATDGGDGGAYGENGTAGGTNSGSGGGGAGGNTGVRGKGGSGILIIRNAR